MRKIKLLKDHWYQIDYKPSKDDKQYGAKPFKGIGKYSGERFKLSSNEIVYIFDLLLNNVYHCQFNINHIVKEVEPVPSFDELYQFYLKHRTK